MTARDVSRYTNQNYPGTMFEHYPQDEIPPGDKIYYAADDYDKLVVARQSELLYIANTLKVCSTASLSDVRDELMDLRAWLDNRRTCFQPGAEEGKTP